jgi:ADP-dependent NAD(P)H-hydrate dehydratase / NAD(P)H-hydrate epimerase
MALVLTAAQMRAVDRDVIHHLGLPGIVLMENAGRGTVEAIERARPGLAGRRAAVVCGAGNNGGDGFVIARHLKNRGVWVQIYLVVPRSRILGDARLFLEVAEHLGVPIIEEAAADEDPRSWMDRFSEADLVVDAIFGTGLRAPVQGAAAVAIAAMNSSRAFRVAVDIPSGLDADSGLVHGAAVTPDLTATMGALKTGLVLDPATAVGTLVVVDLGVSSEALTELVPRPVCHWLDQESVAALLPDLPRSGHKGDRGHTLVVAGSVGKTGAALLSARGALRAGAGLVTIASTRDAQQALDAKVIEVMTACYTAGADADEQSYGQLVELSRRMQAVALGPGIPTGPGTQALVRRLAAELPLPLVIDADGLNHLGAEAAAVLSGAPAPRILTPHPGEMARLCGLGTAAVQSDRLGVTRRLAAATGAVVVLKGARTVIADPDGTAWINPAADPALGTAGTGDVLTGVITGLLARRMRAAHAAQVGVFVHGESAGEARRALGTGNLVAGDLPEAVARVFERLSLVRARRPLAP